MPSNQIAFVLNDVADYQSLIAGVPADMPVYVLDAAGDALAQMAGILASYQGLDAIHLLSHGSAGAVRLGSARLDGSTLAQYQPQLSAIGTALAENGDILLYGCNVAAGEAGIDLIGRLAQVTGADVAASSDLTGAASQGGDWELEIAHGSIEARQPFSVDALQSFAGVLGNSLPRIFTGEGDTIQFVTGTPTPTFRLPIPSSGVSLGDTVRLSYLGQSQAGQPLTQEDLDKGYVDVALSLQLQDAAGSMTAVPVKWIDWTSATATSADGTFTTETGSVTAKLTSTSDLAEVQTTPDSENFWKPSAPYTSPGVAAPQSPDIVQFADSGNRTLNFSTEVTNLYFGFVSMNGNGYRFDRDFDILSQATVNGGYWGTGEAQKREVVIDGTAYYELYAVEGEPHGVIRFKGAFSTLTWNNPTSEYWHGFTVGVKSSTNDLQNVQGEFLRGDAVVATTASNLVSYDPSLTDATGVLDTTVSAARLTEGDAALKATGSLSLFDSDAADVLTATVESVTISGASGNLNLDNNAVKAWLNVATTDTDALTLSKLNWSFDSGTETFDALSLGEELVLSYAVAASDGAGGTATSQVTVTIAGTNEAPIRVLGSEDTEKTITLTDLQGSAEGATSFVVKSVEAGTLRIGTTADSATSWVAGTNDTVDATHQAYWSTAPNANGSCEAFSVALQGSSVVRPVIVYLAPDNDAPSITAGTTTTFTEQTPVAVAGDMSLNDLDGDADWTGGTLKVQITANAEAADGLSLPDSNPGGSGIWLDGTTLKAGSTAIGSANAGSVSNDTEWTFTFDASATNALVQDLARAIRFNNSSDTPGTSNRTVTFTATDKASVSSSATQTVSITAVNDAPTISEVPGTPQAATTGITTALADFTVADADGDNLTLTLTATNGSIGGLTDADDTTAGIQLTGTASAINTALAGATFTATDAGAASIGISVHDTVVDSPTTATYNLTASPVFSYLSGQEHLIIGEADNDAFSISGFVLGNAADADDTASVLTISISAAHGTVALGTTTDITISTGSNDGTDKTLVFNGSIADLRTAINTLRYDPDDTNLDDDPLEIKISSDGGANWQPYTVDVPGKFYYAFNGHYYAYIEAPGINWDDAKTAAEASELYGLNGYLVTVTSKAENDFITPKLTGYGWMGASDAAQEGTWIWVGGPEAGVQFWQDEPQELGQTETFQGSAVNGMYQNWSPFEPNNYGGNEDYAHFYGDGTWNDYPSTHSVGGYVIEYGGNGTTDFGTLTPANLTIAVNQAPVVGDVGDSAAFTEQTPVAMASGITLHDVNGDADWTGGTLKVQITQGNESTDSISLPTSSDSGIWLDGTTLMSGSTQIGTADVVSASNGAALTLTFNAHASNALVQATARALLFNNTSDTPSTTNRTVTFTATDKNGASTSATQVITVTAVHDAPMLGAGSQLSFLEGSGAATLNANLSITQIEAEATQISGAKITIASVVAGDVLKFTDQNGITGTYNADTGVLTLSGTATMSAYQDALRSITYQSTSNDPTVGGTRVSREVSWQITDTKDATSSPIGQAVETYLTDTSYTLSLDGSNPYIIQTDLAGRCKTPKNRASSSPRLSIFHDLIPGIGFPIPF